MMYWLLVIRVIRALLWMVKSWLVKDLHLYRMLVCAEEIYSHSLELYLNTHMEWILLSLVLNNSCECLLIPFRLLLDYDKMEMELWSFLEITSLYHWVNWYSVFLYFHSFNIPFFFGLRSWIGLCNWINQK